MSRRPRARAGALFVDSGGWIAFFSARDQHHREADVLFRQAAAKRTPLITTNLVIAEVHRLLLHRAGTRIAAVALDRICQSDLVEIVLADEALHQQARAWLTKLGDQTITYTDAASFAVMQRHGCKLALTFDRDFVIAGFARAG